MFSDPLHHLHKAIREIPDFPKKGIIFKDITPLLKDPKLFHLTIESMAAPFLDKKVQYIVGIESRGFIFGAALALRLGAGFIPVRKKGKLPWRTKKIQYALEYGEDCLEIHEDAFDKGDRVLISDDLLATGGTAHAVIDLLQHLGAEVVGMSFLIELSFLNGRKKLEGYQIATLLQY